MDMQRHIPRWLDTAAIERRGGDYEGVIDAVTEKPIHDRYAEETCLQPVIIFRDGERTIPNISQRRALCEVLGTNTDRWIGVRVRIFLRRIGYRDRRTGERKIRLERAVMMVGDPVCTPAARAAIPETEVRADEISFEGGFVHE